MKHWIFPIINAFLCISCAPIACWAQEPKPEELYTKALPSTMTLTVDKGSGKVAIGTAFICIKDGMAVTAWHVVRDAKRVMAKFSSGEEFEASGLVDKDEARDIAIIRVKVFGRPTLPTVTSDPSVGAKAFVIGSPKGLEFSFSDGLISQIQMIEGVKQFQFTCAASPGNSGGPLINAKGEVIGVVSWQVRDGQNLNFAVPISYVMGLDSTLPTQPWEMVKPSTPIATNNSGVKAVTTEEFDKLLADSLILDVTGYNLISWIYSNVLEKRFGYEAGIPREGYAVKSDIEERAAKLAITAAPDTTREKWRVMLVDSLKKKALHLDAVAKAIKYAQSNRGFSREANEFLKEAEGIELRESPVKITEEDKVPLKASQPFMSTLPIDLQISMGFRENDEGFRLGVSLLPRNPTALLVFFKDSLAAQIGFKEGDKVIGVNGRTVTTLHDIKMEIKVNLNKKIKATVQRGGKIQEIELKIPTMLPSDK